MIERFTISINLRESGFGLITRMPWGSHIAQLHNDRGEYQDILYPYINAGLQNNEMCVWIFNKDTSFEREISILEKYVDDIDSYIESGQLFMISSKEWYLKDGTFLETRVNGQWKELMRDALDKGFYGLRAAADISWLGKEDFASFSRYEDIINKTFIDLPFLALCLYDASKMDVFETAEVIKNHSHIITFHDNGPKLIKNIELLYRDRQMNKSRPKYKRLIEILPDSVLIHDNKSIFFSNEAASYITGTKDIRKLGSMSVLDFVPSENKRCFLDFINKSMNDDGEHYLRCKVKYQDGELRDTGITTTRYDYQGHNALLSVIRDNTPFIKVSELEREVRQKKKKLDEALEYDRIKAEFLSNISHEFRTPLNVIFSAIQLIRLQRDQGMHDISSSKCFKAIQQNCFRLLRLINNLIDITKIDSNFYEIKLQNCNIIGLIEEIVTSVRLYAENKGIEVVFSTNQKGKVIACDPDQIERIVLNLLSNAVKFTPRGGRIGVSVIDMENVIRISIKDTGIGIPEDKQEKIFDRFQQVDKSLRKQFEGSGIGLSIVEALVKKHDGIIDVYSEPGKGSEFIIELPWKILPEEVSEFNHRYIENKHNHVEKINVEFSDIYM